MDNLFGEAVVEMDKQGQLATLAEQVAGCERCPLHRSRRNTVFGEGDPDSPLVLIGEGPGEHEDASGRPFVGRAGAELDGALQSFGISRRDVYITNIIKCRAFEMEDGHAANRSPNPDEVQSCTAWLDAQLMVIHPRVICCLGGPSAKLIIDSKFKISEQHGTFYPCRWAPLATAALHPAYVLRRVSQGDAGARDELRQDLERAWNRAQEPVDASQPIEDQLRLF